jgi:RNA polymerase sigma factor (sigma-70 family)
VKTLVWTRRRACLDRAPPRPGLRLHSRVVAVALQKHSESSSALEAWEYALVRGVAAGIRTTDRDDLESVLAIHLLSLKLRFTKVVRNWHAFATRAVRNKASNWIRDRQLLERQLISLDRPIGEDDATDLAVIDTVSSSDSDLAVSTAIQLARAALDARLRRVWDALVEAGGNQVLVANNFGVHRNTVRQWVRQLRTTLSRHGFERLP